MEDRKSVAENVKEEWVTPVLVSFDAMIAATGAGDKCGSQADEFTALTGLDGTIVTEEECLELF